MAHLGPRCVTPVASDTTFTNTLRRVFVRDYVQVPRLYPDAVNAESIRRFTSLLADASRDASPRTSVPTCGDWTLDDLLWHLTEVQDFWTFVIATRPNAPKDYEQPERTSGRRLIAGLRHAATGLAEALDNAGADEPAWSWADEQTVGFTIRRQTHEALIHCIDGFLALNLSLPRVSAELVADGIDEIVHVMLQPNTDDTDDDPKTFGTITIHATDTHDRWTINMGEGDCTIAGAALHLNLWLWGRGRTWPLTISGAAEQADLLRAEIASKTH